MTTQPSLLLPARILEYIQDHLAEKAPQIACGFLLGNRSTGAITGAGHLRNASKHPTIDFEPYPLQTRSLIHQAEMIGYYYTLPNDNGIIRTFSFPITKPTIVLAIYLSGKYRAYAVKPGSSGYIVRDVAVIFQATPQPQSTSATGSFRENISLRRLLPPPKAPSEANILKERLTTMLQHPMTDKKQPALIPDPLPQRAEANKTQQDRTCEQNKALIEALKLLLPTAQQPLPPQQVAPAESSLISYQLSRSQVTLPIFPGTTGEGFQPHKSQPIAYQIINQAGATDNPECEFILPQELFDHILEEAMIAEPEMIIGFFTGIVTNSYSVSVEQLWPLPQDRQARNCPTFSHNNLSNYSMLIELMNAHRLLGGYFSHHRDNDPLPMLKQSFFVWQYCNSYVPRFPFGSGGTFLLVGVAPHQPPQLRVLRTWFHHQQISSIENITLKTKLGIPYRQPGDLKLFGPGPTAETRSSSSFQVAVLGQRPVVTESRPVAPLPHTDVALPPGAIRLGTDAKTGQPVVLHQEQRYSGTQLIGATGSGKTNLLLQMIMQDIEQGVGVCVLDPHATLVEQVLRRMPRSRINDVVLFDPSDITYPPSFNLFACDDPSNALHIAQATSQVMQVFQKLWSSKGMFPDSEWGVQLGQLLHHSSHTLLANRNLTMLELPLLLRDATIRDCLISAVNNAEVRGFWEGEYNPMNERDQRLYRGSTIRRVEAFTTHEVVNRIIGQSETTIDIADIVNNGKILLVPLRKEIITDEAVVLLGSLLIRQIMHTVMSRPLVSGSYSGKPFHLFADEYGYFASGEFSKFLTEGRKYKVATTVAHQHLEAIAATRADTMQVSTLIAFHVSGDDAQSLAREYRAVPGLSKLTRREAVLGVTSEPVGWLLSNSHNNQTVLEFVQHTLKAWAAQPDYKLVDRVSHSVGTTATQGGSQSISTPGHYRGDPSTTITSSSSRGTSESTSRSHDPAAALSNQATFVLRLVNRYFVTMMERSEAPYSAASLQRVLTIAEHLTSTLYPYADIEFTEETKALLLKCIETTLAHLHGKATAIDVAKCLEPLVEVQSQRNNAAAEKVRTDVRALVSVMLQLLVAGEALAREPIQAQTGQYLNVPISEQTRQDKREEIADELSHLSTGVAWIKHKRADGSFTETEITTSLPDPVDEEQAELTATLIRHSRLQPGRSRQLVDVQIAARQARLHQEADAFAASRAKSQKPPTSQRKAKT